jgi:hypothetical protein
MGKIRIWDKNPGSTTLIRRVANPDHVQIVAGTSPDLEILRLPDPNSYVPFSTEARKFRVKNMTMKSTVKGLTIQVSDGGFKFFDN